MGWWGYLRGLGVGRIIGNYLQRLLLKMEDEGRYMFVLASWFSTLNIIISGRIPNSLINTLIVIGDVGNDSVIEQYRILPCRWIDIPRRFTPACVLPYYPPRWIDPPRRFTPVCVTVLALWCLSIINNQTNCCIEHFQTVYTADGHPCWREGDNDVRPLSIIVYSQTSHSLYIYRVHWVSYLRWKKSNEWQCLAYYSLIVYIFPLLFIFKYINK